MIDLNSPFKAQLHTNFVPSDAECEKIRAVLAPRVVQLDLLHQRIRELSAERDKLQAYVDSHAALISYPRRLPVDVVREIFVACPPTDRNAVMSAHEAPLLVSRICSSWRAIALTTPELWASLHISAIFVLEDPERRIPAISQWLQRSGSCPISLSLAFMGRVGPQGLKMMNNFDNWRGLQAALMECLADSAHRWGRLDIWDLTLGVAHPLLAMIQASYSARSADTSALRQLGISRGPNLRRMNIWRLDINPDDAEQPQLDVFLLDLPFFSKNFTHLHIESTGPSGGLSPIEVLNLLSRCPRLVSFTFMPTITRTQDVDRNSGREPITLPFLESFTMIEAGAAGLLTLETLGLILGVLVLPALRRLHIPTVEPPVRSGLDRRHIFLLEIETGLESLLINLDRFTTAEILEILGHFTNLAELKILDTRAVKPIGGLASGSCTVDGLLRFLTPNAEAGAVTLCPELQTLEIRNSSLVSRELLDGFARGRAELGTGFRRLDISWFTDPQEQLFSPDELADFRARGVELSLVVPENLRSRIPAKSSPWTGLPN
ncbi:hypothetical protein FB45DRAFT_890684 [Roridomyces roridus]|uniref:F-box domain-containing protein n=1 Tax=Roridomyces roridus TaxID=1738132 RepID=A0AAD7CDM7_9AGAR|nr:hypothetical protein FB45DRAFT_890684 [Roridomyces roridus]